MTEEESNCTLILLFFFYRLKCDRPWIRTPVRSNQRLQS